MRDDDDLKDLSAALRAATPAPDAERKAATIALAKKNFADLQESGAGARPNSDHPKVGWVRGVREMLNSLNPRAALTASTALIAVGLLAIVPDWQKGGTETLREAFPAPLSAPETLLESAEREAPAPAPQAAASDVSIVTASKDAAPAGTADSAIAEPDGMARTRGIARTAPLAAIEEGYAAPAAGLIAPAPMTEPMAVPAENTEAFPDAQTNPLQITSESPVSTFSIDVDTASYAVVRSSLSAGQLPPPDAVRIEEMINYFPYDYPAPEAGGAPFRPTVRVVQTPWNPDTRLVHVAIQGQRPATEDRPPLNLVFLIDTSGSMNQPDKLPLLRQSLALMLSRLMPQDQVAIVAYAGSAGQVLAPTAASERATILGALERLAAGGSTAGQAGLQQAYAVAEGMAAEGEVTRVILATDGDFNVGLSGPEDLKAYIAEKRESGTYLSVLGFGRGNLDDATMQALAQNGNGQAAYIDTLSEAQKVLVDQFTGALFPIANDVKIQVEFNPAEIAEYRLIGYETRTLNREDFNNDRVDAGEIGAGHSVTALYEVTPVDSPARLTDPLRYQSQETGDRTGEFGFLRLRYKMPGAEESALIEAPIRADQDEVGPDIRFSIAIAGFGQLLRGNDYLGDWGYDEAIALATATKGEDAFGYRAEAVRLMRLAQSLSE
jgi:Ca-activated chloride channel family protein